jgi:hypothetical protein
MLKKTGLVGEKMKRIGASSRHRFNCPSKDYILSILMSRLREQL